VTRVAGPVDQPHQQTKYRQHNQKEKYGEKPHLFLVQGWIPFALIGCLEKHTTSYCKPA